MKSNIPLGMFTILVLTASNYVHAATFTIGDNDGYGLGIPDGGSYVFSPVPPNYDQRSAGEKAVTNGAQFTDTYSTTHPGFSPQKGTLATFTFEKLGKGWKSANLLVDIAEFESSKYGSPLVNINGFKQDWHFDDGLNNTAIHNFDLSKAIVASINATSELVITVDRGNSNDFYGFDYLQLSSQSTANIVTPVPAAFWLFGSAFVCLSQFTRRKKL